MKTYNIATTAGYKGCGVAFATIHNNIVVDLTYIDNLLSADDWDYAIDDDDPAGDIPNVAGEAKIALFAEVNPKLVRGMCSCWQFSVQD